VIDVPILVTGGGGFIGSVVVRKLIAAGRPVRCLLRPTSETSRIDGLAFERVAGDVRDPAAVARALDGCELAIHLAGIVSWDRATAADVESVIVDGTRTVLAAARAAGCRKLVYVSSILAVSGSRSPQAFDESPRGRTAVEHLRFVRAKTAAEAACRDAATSDLSIVIVNPAEVYGPEDIALITASNLVDFASASPVLVCAGGTGVVHVDDVAEGIIAALDRGRAGERYILSGDNLTLRELAGLTLDLLGRPARIVTLPRWLVRAIAWVGRHFHIPLPFNPEVIPYATSYWFVDSAKAQRELGVRFRSARETLAPTVAWLRQAGHVK
jgi:dihydroflavonol-4-reductase